MFTTLLEPDELLVEASFPNMPPHTGWALQEVARRPHDFALVGVAALVTLDKDNLCQKARIVFLSVGDGPVEAHLAAETLTGQTLTQEIIHAAAETAATADIDPGSDIHASAEYRRRLAEVLTRRALDVALERAKGGG